MTSAFGPAGVVAGAVSLLMSGPVLGGRVPLLDLAAGGAFTRASVAARDLGPGHSRIDIVAANVRRLEDRGDGLGPLLRTEIARNQNIIFSEQIDLLQKTNCTATANASAGPDETGGTPLVTADRIRATAGGAECNVFRALAVGAGKIGTQLYIKYDDAAGATNPSTTASLEITDGTSTRNIDVALTPGMPWMLVFTEPVITLVGAPTIRVRPHHKGVNPSINQSILVFGWNAWTDSNGIAYPTSYVPCTNPVVNFAPERLTYVVGQYDPRLLSRPAWLWWVPDHDWPGDGLFVGDDEFLSIGSDAGSGGTNSVTWGDNDGSVWVRAANAGAPRARTTPITYSRGQKMRVAWNPAAGTVRVIGATTGGEPFLVAPWDWATEAVTKDLVVAGRSTDNAHALKGRMSAPFLGSP